MPEYDSGKALYTSPSRDSVSRCYLWLRTTVVYKPLPEHWCRTSHMTAVYPVLVVFSLLFREQGSAQDGQEWSSGAHETCHHPSLPEDGKITTFFPTGSKREITDKDISYHVHTANLSKHTLLPFAHNSSKEVVL